MGLEGETAVMKRFVVCLDGTWNNAAKEVERKATGDRVYRPTNVLKLARGTLRADGHGTSQITIYDTGVGSMNRAPTGMAKVARKIDNLMGGAFGAGFETNVEQAYTFLANNWEVGDEVFIFGFSRGAAQARSLTNFIGWVGGFPEKADAYYVPTLFTEYLQNHGESSGAAVWEARNEKRRRDSRPELEPIRQSGVRYLGVWDTVLALGRKLKRKASPELTFHVPRTPPAHVDRVRHAIAIDERRHDFRADIFDAGGADLEQRWFCGVHSSVGGGLLDDSHANCALRWLVEEAKGVGLAIDEKFLSHYDERPGRPIPSKAGMYKLLDTVLRPIRGFRGERDLLEVDGMTLDDTVYERLNDDNVKPPYLPKNLLRYLAEHSELHDKLSERVRRAALKARK
jgi:hypothetical protein